MKSWGTNSDSTLLHNTNLVLFHPQHDLSWLEKDALMVLWECHWMEPETPMHWFFKLFFATKFHKISSSKLKRNILSQNNGPILNFFHDIFWVNRMVAPSLGGKISRLSLSPAATCQKPHCHGLLTSSPYGYVLVEVVPQQQQQLTFWNHATAMGHGLSRKRRTMITTTPQPLSLRIFIRKPLLWVANEIASIWSMPKGSNKIAL